MKTVFDALARHAGARPKVVALRDDAGAVTWAELAGRVAALAAALADAPRTIAIALPGGIDYVVADLAVTLAGRRQVPLPFFFSNAQNAHILADAGVGAVIARDGGPFAALPHLRVINPGQVGVPPNDLPDYPGRADRVIYTSGSSGRPKGVLIGDRQLSASLSALSRVVRAGHGDRHLSILPLAQLLEQICGVFLPIMAGAQTVFRFEATKALFGAPIAPLADAFAETAPTTSLLAPALLGRWVAELAARGERGPASLRFLAVGGAATPPALLAAAERAGIPVCEGYGLSECCAVVATNRPGEAVAGTVGQVLDGVSVTLEEGEIVVEGPTVMAGYLNSDPAPARWHTGDMGHMQGGRLVIDGRKDALLVTGAGRNISPEWVEQRLNADPRIVSSALCLSDKDGALVLVVAAAAPLTPVDLCMHLCDLPDYARPTRVIFTRPDEPGLLFPVGTPDRAVARHIAATRDAQAIPAPSAKERLAS